MPSPPSHDAPSNRGPGSRQLSDGEKSRLLLDISRRSRGTLDLEETLDRLLDAVSEVVSFDAAGIFALSAALYPVPDRPAGVIAGVARRGFVARPDEEDEMLSAGRGIVGHAIRTGESVLVRDVREDPRYVVGRSEALSEIAVPIVVDGRTIAALDVESDRLAAFDENDVERLDFFAEAAALAIEKAMLHRHLVDREQLEAQLRLARQVQRSLLPDRPPKVDGWELAAVCQPSLELSGDYFDFLPRDDGRQVLVVADVAGKGVPAALIMATFRAILRSRLEDVDDLAEIVASANRLLLQSSTARSFVTSFCGVLDPASGRLRYVSCGHPPALVRRISGDVHELDTTGPAIGVFADAAFHSAETTLSAGEVLALYTDGLTEAMDPVGEQFGVDRLRSAMEAWGRGSAGELADRLVRRAREFVARPHLADDLTVVIARQIPS